MREDEFSWIPSAAHNRIKIGREVAILNFRSQQTRERQLEMTTALCRGWMQKDRVHGGIGGVRTKARGGLEYKGSYLDSDLKNRVSRGHSRRRKQG